MTLDGCEVGDAKITGGHKLPAKFVVITLNNFVLKLKDSHGWANWRKEAQIGELLS
jgi:hypothetical protein